MEVSGLASAASSMAARSRSFVSETLEDRSTQLGTAISATAENVRRIAGELREGGALSAPADALERGADLVARVGTYLTDADGDRLIRDAEDVARRRPWLVALGALLTGFAASRVMKVSSVERYRESNSHAA